jgi:hypothetical protein
VLCRLIRVASVLGIGLVFGFVRPPTAAAKFCVLMDAPPSAHVGQLVTVRVMTLADGVWVDGRLVQRRPGLPLPDRIVVTVVDPTGDVRTSTLERSSRPDMQRGRLALDRRGTWEVKVRTGRYSSCAAAQQIRVV